MNANIIVRNALKVYSQNQMIFASKLYKEKLSDLITEAAYYKILERMNISGELKKISKGIYTIPKKTDIGIVPISNNEIVNHYISDNNGIIIGYKLYNSLNLTTQISKRIEILSSEIEEASKNIKDVYIKKVNIEFTDEIKRIVSALEIFQNFIKIEDINNDAFFSYTKEFAESYNEKCLNEVLNVMKYKKSTLSFMKNVLDYYKVDNNIDLHLSSLSKYSHPKMEELCETT